MYTEKTKENSPNCLQPDILTCHHWPIAYPRVILSDGPLLQRQYFNPCYPNQWSRFNQKPSRRSQRPRKREVDLGAP
jgi:hypothetical protein